MNVYQVKINNMFTATIKLEEVLKHCNDWKFFCWEEGWSEWCVNEGGGDIEIVLTKEKLIKYGLI
jgi:hypothetical protein